MALEDRIRSTVDPALSELTARLDADVRAIIQQLISAALDERDKAIAAVRREAHNEATAELQREIEETETRGRTALDEAVQEARTIEREAEIAALARLLDSVRSLDGASSLSEVLDVLGHSAGRETSRAAVLVVKLDRLVGWRLSGFGSHDTQPKAIDMSLEEAGIVGLAARAARPITTRGGERGAHGPGFARLPDDRIGFAVPVMVGGRAVAVVYADSVAREGRDHVVPSAWPEVIEILARHAARCLEALTAQKAASHVSPRFWVPGAGGPSAAPGGSVTQPARQTSLPTEVGRQA